MVPSVAPGHPRALRLTSSISVPEPRSSEADYMHYSRSPPVLPPTADQAAVALPTAAAG